MKASDRIKTALKIVFVCIIIYLQHIQFSYSATVAISKILRMNVSWQLLNWLIVAMFFLTILFITKRVGRSLIISTLIIGVLSIANYYDLLFHGSPFLASDLYSLRTAMNVLSEYQLSLDKIVVRLLVLLILELLLIAVYYLFFRSNKKTVVKRKCSFMLLMLDCLVLWIVFFSPWTLFPQSLFSWSWGPAVNEYGYEVSFLNSVYLLNHKLVVPDGYSAEKLTAVDRDNYYNNADKPDIILILNETFCDISYYSSISESAQIFKPLYDSPDIIHGFTTVSLIGGGTNNSEYELLTSNSMSGLSVSAPFLSLDISEANSLVSYLNTLDYHTIGMHCGNRTNYGRHVAYYALGFDDVYLGKDDFTEYSEYGRRPWLDEDNYKNMIQLYESTNEVPRFIYLLTYQNHGGYQQNDSKYDTISISENAGEYTDDVNEYLTSISQSVDAFEWLIDYYKNSKRPVIILMVGDHAPSFIQELPIGSNKKEVEGGIAQRTVPYFVWANFEIDKSVYAERSSMIDIVPMLLKSINAPLTEYYQTIMDLNKIVPVRTYTGVAEDFEGNIFRIEKGEPYFEQIQHYLYMEYNNLLKGTDYKKALFELEK